MTVARVVYLGRRLDAAPAFHADAIALAGDPAGDPARLVLESFTGVGPGAYPGLFARHMTAWNHHAQLATDGEP